MVFRKNPIHHQFFRDTIRFCENRLVFVNKIEEGIQQSIKQIDRDIEALEARRDSEMDIAERQRIGSEIEALMGEKAELEERGAVKEVQASSVYAGLTQKVEEIEREIGQEMDLKVRKEKKDKMKLCLENINKLRHVPKDPVEFKRSVSDWNLDNTRIEKLGSEKLDYLYLGGIAQTEIGSFFDNETLAQIEIENERMKSADFLKRVNEPIDKSTLKQQAYGHWLGHKKEIEKSLEEANAKSNDKSLTKSEREYYSEHAELMEMELETGEEDWIGKKMFGLEEDKAFVLRDRISEEVIDRTKSFVIEARGLRENAMLEYFKNRISQSKKNFKKLAKKKPPRFSQEQIDDNLHFIEGFINENLSDPDLFNRGEENIQNINKSLDKFDENLKDVSRELEMFDQLKSKKGREALRQDLQAKASMVKSKASEFNAERIEGILGALEHARKGDKMGELAYKKIKRGFLFIAHNIGLGGYLEPLLQLIDEDPNLHTAKEREFEKASARKGLAGIDEQMQIIDQLKPEEIIDIKRHLDKFTRVLGYVSGEKIDQALGLKPLSDAQTARKLINELADKTDIQEIRKTLEENLDPDHLKFVSKGEFKPYQAYTSSGFMVFYERGDEWKIIINEDAMEDGQALQHQVTHELLHLEFESHAGLKAEFVKLYTQAENWSEIKQKFVEIFPYKRPPNYETEWTKVLPDGRNAKVDKIIFSVADWNDEDIVSELYAMQNDIGDKEEFKPIAKKMIRGAEDDMQALMDKSDSGGGDEGEGEGKEAKSISSPETYADSIKENDKKIKEYLSSEYMPYVPGGAELLRVMKKYNDDTATLNEKYAENNSTFLAGEVDIRIDEIKDNLGKVNTHIQGVATDAPNQIISPLRHFWNNTNFLSIEDIWQVGVDFMEWNSRRHKRKTADHAARLGSALFENLPIVGEIGLEAEARKQKAEQEEVNEWKSRLETKDAWELMGILKGMEGAIDPNKDQFKAILKILADKGRIDWRDPHIWNLLNKMQSAVHLSPNDQILLGDPTMLRSKLHTACGEIWDYDEFLNLERTNESSYESKKKEHMGYVDKIQRQITERLEQLYQKHLKKENVEPMEYEALLEYAIEKGKCNAEAIMFYLIAGMAQGILTMDRGHVLDKHLNIWPAIEYAVSPGIPKAQKRLTKFCENEFGDEFRTGAIKSTGSKFKHFYWTKVQNEQTVLQRTRKTVMERQWDHDWARGIAAMGNAEDIKTFMSGRSGEVVTKPTALENCYVGMLQWSEENALNPNDRDWRSGFTRQIGAFFMSEGVVNDVAYRENKTFQRGANIWNNIAREGSISNHAEWKVGQHRDKMKAFINTFDGPLKEFFRLITDTTGVNAADPEKKGEAKDHLAKIKLLLAPIPGLDFVQSLNTINDIFNKLDLIVAGILNTVDNTSFLSKISTLRKEL